jgi:hypothetical protein
MGNDDLDPLSALWGLHPRLASQPFPWVIEETIPRLGQIGYHDRIPVPKFPWRHNAVAKCRVWLRRIRLAMGDNNLEVLVQGIRFDVRCQDVKLFRDG